MGGRVKIRRHADFSKGLDKNKLPQMAPDFCPGPTFVSEGQSKSRRHIATLCAFERFQGRQRRTWAKRTARRDRYLPECPLGLNPSQSQPVLCVHHRLLVVTIDTEHKDGTHPAFGLPAATSMVMRSRVGVCTTSEVSNVARQRKSRPGCGNCNQVPGSTSCHCPPPLLLRAY